MAELEALLRESDRRRTELLAMLGHELRNPLTPIVAALQVMAARGDDSSLKERQIIDRQVRHLTRLVDDLLDTARVTGGQVKLRRERLRLESVITQAVEQVAPLMSDRALSLSMAEGLTVDGDTHRLSQVVVNLLSNAARFTQPKGEISVAASRQGAQALLMVKDDGVGIEATLLETIFGLFVQAPQTSERPSGGLGVGLALAKSVVELHGGRIWAQSEGKLRGSTFFVELPIAEAEGNEAVAPSLPKAAPSRVLVVDDNVDAADMFAEVLAMEGHDVRVANDGVQALGLVATFQPQTVLLDLGLPGMDGVEVARRLRDLLKDPALRIIAVTGYGQPADKEKTRAAGFNEHLVKPVRMETLLAVLQSPNRN